MCRVTNCVLGYYTPVHVRSHIHTIHTCIHRTLTSQSADSAFCCHMYCSNGQGHGSLIEASCTASDNSTWMYRGCFGGGFVCKHSVWDTPCLACERDPAGLQDKGDGRIKTVTST